MPSEQPQDGTEQQQSGEQSPSRQDIDRIEPPHPLLEALIGAFGDRVRSGGSDQTDTPIVQLSANDLIEILTWLRDSETTRLDYLSCLTAVDWADRKPRFEIVYNLYSIEANHRLTVKTDCPEGEGVPSVVDVWPTADWLERETYDLYGIEFLGHPNLERIFLPEDWEGFPLRKDYPLEGPNLELLTRQQAAFRGGIFDRIRGEYEMTDQERDMASAGVVGALWTPEPNQTDGDE